MGTNKGIAARVRAAQAWAGLSDDELAQALGVSRRTVGRMKSHGDNVDHDRRDLIASVTGVPRGFMHEGWQALPEEPELAERVEALEAQMQTVLRLTATRAGTVRSDVGGEPAVTGLTPPKARRPPRPGSTPSPRTGSPARTETDEPARPGGDSRKRAASRRTR